MGWLRAGQARTVMMRMFRDDLSLLIPVRWYYVPQDRPFLPYATPFGNRRVDDSPTGDWLLGEVLETSRYHGGQPVHQCVGQGACGTREQWERGCLTTDQVAPLNETTGRQCCCGRGALWATVDGGLSLGVSIVQPEQLAEGGLMMQGEALQLISRLAVATGGLLLGGAAVQAQAGGTTDGCAAWPGSPLTWNVTGAGFGNGTCDCSPLNVTRPADWTGACNWQSVEFAWCGLLAHWNLQWWGGVDQLWELSLVSRPVGSSVYITRAAWQRSGATWATLGPNTLALVFSGPHCTWPPTITLNATLLPPAGVNQLGEGGLVLSGEGSQLVDLLQLGDGGLVLAGDGAQLLDLVQLGEGGLLLGGQAGQLRDARQLAAGGLVLGGQATQTKFNPVVPGATCAAAPLIALGTLYGPYTMAAAPSDNWFRLPTISGTHKITTTVHSGGSTRFSHRFTHGALCPGSALATQNLTSNSTFCTSGNITGAIAWVRFAVTSGGGAPSYSFTVQTGAC